MPARRKAELQIVQHVTEIVLQRWLLRTRPCSLSDMTKASRSRALSFVLCVSFGKK